jgi:hypothetical protein
MVSADSMMPKSWARAAAGMSMRPAMNSASGFNRTESSRAQGATDTPQGATLFCIDALPMLCRKGFT